MDERFDEFSKKAKDFSRTEIGKKVVSGAKGAVQSKVRDLKRSANAKGVGGVLDLALDLAEKKTGIDLDGDGDAGK